MPYGMKAKNSGVYAVNTGKSFIAHGTVHKARKVTPEQEARREYFKTHRTVIGEDEHGNVTVRVEEI